MIYLAIYLIIAAIVAALDFYNVFCDASHRTAARMIVSILFGALWPVSAIAMIVVFLRYSKVRCIHCGEVTSLDDVNHWVMCPQHPAHEWARRAIERYPELAETLPEVDDENHDR